MFGDIFGKKKANTGSSASDQYLHLKLKEVRKETADAVTLIFDTSNEAVDYQPGQFFTLIPTINGEEVRRSYSVCTSPDTDEFPGVTVKRVKDGLVSNFLNDNAEAGQVLKVMRPNGNFVPEVDSSKKRNVVLLGGGSGITPLMSILKSVLHHEERSEISLLYANRDEASIIFKDELDQLQEKYGSRLKVMHLLESPQDDSYPKGLVSSEHVKRFHQEYVSEDLQKEYFMCGPQGYMDTLERIMPEIGLGDIKIKKESFVSTKLKAKDEGSASPQSETRKVTLIYDDEEYVVEVSPDKTILEAALDA
ncbi:MAG: oxidoreductase, partial [Cyclobacteriaceae bacterium]|nr:oxidoreductase [Cyclobacteriaceae bacterium]